MKTSLSITEARRIILSAQGLSDEAPFGLGPTGVLRTIEHLGYVQIDTISVVERAHHHVLWSRVPDYRPSMLGELQVHERKVFEYWSHAAAYLPWRDYRYCLPRMDRLARGQHHWFVRNRKVMSQVLDRIRAEGPLLARDFEAPKGHRSGSWFEWKPAKRALEQLFMEGKLMVRERRGFQKVFDLAERVVPPGVDVSMPTPHEMALYLARQAIRSHGIAAGPEMRYLRKNMQTPMTGALLELKESGEIRQVEIQGLVPDKHTLFASTANLSKQGVSTLRILSPFDNFVIQRKRLQRLFEFDYLIECYVPEPKRKHGYFCLPLLWGERMIGRIDAKADRKAKTLRVIKIIYEPGFRERGKVASELKKALAGFAAFNGCERVEIL